MCFCDVGTCIHVCGGNGGVCMCVCMCVWVCGCGCGCDVLCMSDERL